MRRVKQLAPLAGLLAAAFATAGPAAAGEPLKAALDARVSLLDAAGEPSATVVPGEPFRIRLTFESLVAGTAPEVEPQAWIRPVSPSNLDCRESAASFRATGRGPVGAVTLGGLRLGVVHVENGFALVDPDRGLAAANLVAAAQLKEPPAALVADRERSRFLVSLPAAGRVEAIDLQGRASVLAEGLAAPTSLVPYRDGVAVLESASGDLVDIGDAGIRGRLALGARAVTAGPQGSLGADTADGVALAQLPDTLLLRRKAPGAVSALPFADASGALGLAWLEPGRDGPAMAIAWLDGGGTRVRLGRAATAIAVAPDGRFAIAYGGTQGGAEIVDIGRGRVVQAIGSHAAVAEVAFAGTAAFLRLADGSMVGIVDLRTVREGAPPAMGEVDLGAPGAADGTATLLALLDPEPGVIAVHPETYTGFFLTPAQATSGMPPSAAIQLRGGHPRLVAALDAGLRETGPGVFETTATVPRGIPHELVVSAGLGQAAFCAALPVRLDPAATASGPGRLALAGSGRLRLLDADGHAAPGLTGTLVVSALTGNFRRSASFEADAAGEITVPAATRPGMVLVISAEASDGRRFAPLVLDHGR